MSPSPRVPRRVLVIDDDPVFAEVLARALGPGFAVETCMNGEAGLERARAEVPDLVVLDVMMPGVHGLFALRRLKGDPATARVPVVMTSSMGEELRGPALGAGAAAYLVKGGPLAELLARVREVLAP